MKDFDPQWLNTIDQIYHCGWSSRKLLRIRLLKRSIAHFWPDGFPGKLIHVAGSNGKGSVCRLLQAALSVHGTCGAWVNPHLFDWGERFRLGDTLAPRAEIVDIWQNRVLPHSLDRAEQHPDHACTFAEAGLLIALHLFADHKVPWAVLETGVGGRYAPTMAVDPALCLLSNIGTDHPGTLGTEAWQIALEKAGIARHGVPLISMEDGGAESFVQQTSLSQGALYSCPGESHRNRVRDILVKLKLPAQSRHWLSNAALALAAAEELEPKLPATDAVFQMANQAALKGRFWKVQPGLIADVAHNPEKLAALAADLKRSYPDTRFRFLLGVSRQRHPERMFAELEELASDFVLTEASYAGQDPAQVKAALDEAGFNLPMTVCPNPAKALEGMLAERSPEQWIVLTGSAYTVDQALNPDPWLKQLNREFGRRGKSPELVPSQFQNPQIS